MALLTMPLRVAKGGKMKKKAVLFATALLISLAFVSACLAFEAPVITLDRVEVASIQPFFVKPRVEYKNEKEPGKELAAGAMLNMAYVFDIKNPNKVPVMLDELSFTTAFEGFEVNTAFSYENSWIPAGKTNQLKVITTNETLPTITSLMVAAENVQKLQEKKLTAGAVVKKWWENVGDFSFPIEVKAGTALFKDEKGKELRVTFTGKWPKK
jgi:archaellum component FlaG (FlaF/FlaG flagellin family)